MANIVCPHCHEELEMDGEMAVGEKLVCPCCGKAFVYYRKSSKSRTLSNVDTSSQRGIGIGRTIGRLMEHLCGAVLWLVWAARFVGSIADSFLGEGPSSGGDLGSILTLLYFMSAVAFTKWCINSPKK